MMSNEAISVMVRICRVGRGKIALRFYGNNGVLHPDRVQRLGHALLSLEGVSQVRAQGYLIAVQLVDRCEIHLMDLGSRLPQLLEHEFETTVAVGTLEDKDVLEQIIATAEKMLK